MSRAVFTSFFPHFLFYSYIISFSRIIVKSKMRLLPSKKGSRVEVFWLTPWTFRKYGFGTSRKHLITFLTFKFHFHNQSLVWVYLFLFSDLIVTPNGLNVKGLLKKSGRPGARTPAWCPPLQTLFQYCTVLFCISLFFYCSNPIFSALHPDRITLFPNVKPPGNAGARRWESWSFYLCFSAGSLLILPWGGV